VGAPVIRYGLFLNTLLEFLIIALCIFFLVKKMASLVLLDKIQDPKP
jgi:large conductance mechanosensitive channel